ncbi:TIGR03545 family protein [bacterium]|nr:TIGR03545 family protein [bacterium]
MNTTETQTSAAKVKKTQGIIRWNAIIPFLIISALVYLYFVLFFDAHMKRAIEWGGYKALGTELNIGEFKSSFIKGNVRITKIELTNRETPQFNSIELGDIRFDVKWDALLRVKFVIEEIAVEGVQFMSKRAYPGKVAPPEVDSNEPGFAQQLQDKALNKLDKENQNNILGDAAQFLKTGKFDDQIKNLEGQLASKKMLEDMNAKWTAKRTDWDAKIKSLPTGPELNALNERFNKVKFKDFANLQELDASVKEVDSIVKEIDSKTKQVQDLKSQLDADLKSIDQDYKAIDQQIKTDIATIKSRFKIPKIDAASFAKALFMSYLTPYMQKLDNYKAMATKYLPPKYAKMVNGEKKDSADDDKIQPHPRSEGVTYEFPVKNGYPLFWIQKVSLSSKSNAQSDYGDFTGLISNITSNQRQIGKPTTVKINGSFNKMKLQGIHLDALLNNINKDAIIQYEFGIDSYPIADMQLIQSKDATISIPLTDSSFLTTGEVLGFKNYDIKLNNTFSNVSFQIASENSTVNEVLKSTLGTINKFDLQASAKGELKDLNIDIRSSLGGDLEKAFQKLLQNKINEANEKLQAAINSEINKLKTQFTAQVDSLKAQAQTEVKKLQTQIDDQKKQAETKIAQAKKDFEDKAKAQVQKEGQKQLDDLKKKLGL